MHRQAPGPSEQQTLFACHPASREERVLVGHGHVAVDHTRIEGLGPEVLSDTLDEIRPRLGGRVDRAVGVGPDHLDVGVLFFEVATGSRDGSTGSDSGDEVGDPPLGLSPYLGPGRLVMRAWGSPG